VGVHRVTHPPDPAPARRTRAPLAAAQSRAATNPAPALGRQRAQSRPDARTRRQRRNASLAGAQVPERTARFTSDVSMRIHQTVFMGTTEQVVSQGMHNPEHSVVEVELFFDRRHPSRLYYRTPRRRAAGLYRDHRERGNQGHTQTHRGQAAAGRRLRALAAGPSGEAGLKHRGGPGALRWVGQRGRRGNQQGDIYRMNRDQLNLIPTDLLTSWPVGHRRTVGVSLKSTRVPAARGLLALVGSVSSGYADSSARWLPQFGATLPADG